MKYCILSQRFVLTRNSTRNGYFHAKFYKILSLVNWECCFWVYFNWFSFLSFQCFGKLVAVNRIECFKCCYKRAFIQLCADFFIITFRFSFKSSVLGVNIEKLILMHKLLSFLDFIWPYIYCNSFQDPCFYNHIFNFVVIKLDI